MSRSLHRFLVLAALTVAIAGGLWTVACVDSSAQASTAGSDRADLLGIVERGGETGIVAVRLRTPTPSSVTAMAWRRDVHRTLGRELTQRAAAHPHGVPLYTLLRSYRI